MVYIKKIQEAMYSLELTEKEMSILKAFTGKTTGSGPGFKLVCNLHSAINVAGIEHDETILFNGHFEEIKKWIGKTLEVEPKPNTLLLYGILV